jgi:hypothetical protein
LERDRRPRQIAIADRPATACLVLQE